MVVILLLPATSETDSPCRWNGNNKYMVMNWCFACILNFCQLLSRCWPLKRTRKTENFKFRCPGYMLNVTHFCTMRVASWRALRKPLRKPKKTYAQASSGNLTHYAGEEIWLICARFLHQLRFLSLLIVQKQATKSATSGHCLHKTGMKTWKISLILACNLKTKTKTFEVIEFILLFVFRVLTW